MKGWSRSARFGVTQSQIVPSFQRSDRNVRDGPQNLSPSNLKTQQKPDTAPCPQPAAASCGFVHFCSDYDLVDSPGRFAWTKATERSQAGSSSERTCSLGAVSEIKRERDFRRMLLRENTAHLQLPPSSHLTREESSLYD